ncbi:unnamed protein product [Rhizophagus irregularis]|nr:unnamed protein product [Rhizophagus irregularis]
MVLCRFRSGPPDEALIAARAAGKKSKNFAFFYKQYKCLKFDVEMWQMKRLNYVICAQVSPLNPDDIVNDRSRSHIPFENKSIIKHVQHLPVKFSFAITTLSGEMKFRLKKNQNYKKNKKNV